LLTVPDLPLKPLPPRLVFCRCCRPQEAALSGSHLGTGTYPFARIHRSNACRSIGGSGDGRGSSTEPIEASIHATSSAFCWLAATPGFWNTIIWPVLHPASVISPTSPNRDTPCIMLLPFGMPSLPILLRRACLGLALKPSRSCTCGSARSPTNARGVNAYI